MMFDSFSAFLSMDGYGPFVWSAYGFALLVFAWNIIQPGRRRRKVIAEHRRRLTGENNE